MNKDYILWNLKEAKEELDSTIRKIETDSSYGHGEYMVAMQHLYHHINTAWNAQDTVESDAAECTQENFAAWRQFPSDLDMSV